MSVETIIESTQYLTFKLSDEVFAVEVAKVREILECATITKIPRTPDFMRGVINVRGAVVPVIDLRLKFEMGATEQALHTCIVVLEIGMEGGTTVMGALADSVREVIGLDPHDIEPPPKIGVQLKTEFIRGIGKRADEFIMILDIDNIFSSGDLQSLVETGVPGPDSGMEEAV